MAVFEVQKGGIVYARSSLPNGGYSPAAIRSMVQSGYTIRSGKNRRQERTCTDCGARLDPDEICDCGGAGEWQK